jgi:RES domain-containing protein
MTVALPSLVYRITRGIYARSAAEALSGIGGLHSDGRWHSQGKPIVYTGESSSVCLLERLVHADEWIADRLPDRVVLALNMPAVSFTHYTAAELALVDANWRQEGNAMCRSLGDSWLIQGKYCVMIVPSAADPMARNLLINPAHAQAASFVTANLTLSVTPVDLDDRVVSLAQKRRASSTRT